MTETRNTPQTNRTVDADEIVRRIRQFIAKNQTGKRRPGINRIAEGTNLSRETVRAYIKALDVPAAKAEESAADTAAAQRAAAQQITIWAYQVQLTTAFDSEALDELAKAAEDLARTARTMQRLIAPR